MIGDHLHGDVVLLARAVGLARESRDALDQRREQVRIVVRHLALQDRGDALEPHAGVDRRPRQRRHRAARVAVELHEDEVPDLEPPVALAGGSEAPAARGFLGAREMVALVEVDLRAWAARSRVAHRPEIVLLAEPEDVGVAEPGHLLPQRVRLVVVGEDGRPEPARVEAEVAREELPRKLDRVGLEVIAEREVAEHLEERVMARRAPDVLEVVVLAARAHALLAARGTHVVAPFLAEEDRLELDHARVGEEERRVVAGHERGRAHARVALRLEILEEPFAELGAGHRSANCTIGPRSPPDPRRLNGSEGEGRSKLATTQAERHAHRGRPTANAHAPRIGSMSARAPLRVIRQASLTCPVCRNSRTLS